MKQKLYTFIGCSSVIEKYFQSLDTAADSDLTSALEGLKSIREALVACACQNDSSTSLEEALNDHIVTLLTSIETLRSHALYSAFDDSLVDLLDYYYDICDRKMGGGGGTYFDNGGYDEGKYAD